MPIVAQMTHEPEADETGSLSACEGCGEPGIKAKASASGQVPFELTHSQGFWLCLGCIDATESYERYAGQPFSHERITY